MTEARTATEGRTVAYRIHFVRGGPRKVLVDGPKPGRLPRVPRVARYLALAVRFEQQIRAGVVKDYAEIARLGHVDPSRVTQIMDLLQLAPDIQEEILFLPLVATAADPVLLSDLLPIARLRYWRQQRPRWRELKRRRLNSSTSPLPAELP